MFENVRLNNYRRTYSVCIKCRMCTYGDWPENEILCPMYKAGRYFTYSGGGILFIASALERGLLDYSEAIAEVLYKCTTCGNCDRICEVTRIPKPHAKVTDVLRVLRRELVKKVPEVGNHHRAIVENIKTSKNPFGEKETRANGRASDLSIARKTGRPLIFLGCLTRLYRGKVVDSLVAILREAGIEPLFLEDEWCCGSPLYDLGHWEELDELLEHNTQQIIDLGPSEILFLCPHCKEFISNNYRETLADAGVKARFQHVLAYLNELFQKRKLQKANELGLKKAVSFHEPCYLERVSGEIVGVREMLQSQLGVELTPLRRTGNNSYCCGAGGGVGMINPEFAQKVGEERLSEVIECGGEVLLTACPLCEKNLQGINQSGRHALEIRDVIELIADLVVTE